MVCYTPELGGHGQELFWIRTRTWTWTRSKIRIRKQIYTNGNSKKSDCVRRTLIHTDIMGDILRVEMTRENLKLWFNILIMMDHGTFRGGNGIRIRRIYLPLEYKILFDLKWPRLSHDVCQRWFVTNFRLFETFSFSTKKIFSRLKLPSLKSVSVRNVLKLSLNWTP